MNELTLKESKKVSLTIMNNILDLTFSFNKDKLIDSSYFDFLLFKLSPVERFEFRQRFYIKKSFFILTDNILSEIVEVFKEHNINNSIELQSGLGWLSYWLKKYGCNISQTIDNKTWQNFNSDYLDIVKEEDSISFIEKMNSNKLNKTNVDCIILSWPYMNENATIIWNNLLPGQYMLYIGEKKFGCTASPSFFENFKDKVVYIFKNHNPFENINDYVFLLRK